MSALRSLRARAARRLPAALGRHAEHVTSFAVIRASGLFDPGWYAAQLGGAGAGRLPGHSARLAHYVWRGRRAGLAPHPLMEPSWFAPERWRDDPADPFARLLLRGRVRRRPPHPLFDPAEWVRRHPEAAEHRWGPFGHFCATASPGTPMPVVAPFDGTSLTWGDARVALAAGLEAWLADERLRRAVRPAADHDEALATETVRRFAGFGSAAAAPDEPLVSVVMPVRDRAGVVGAAIASVRAQTFTGWELVVVDDGSSDGTPAVVRALAAEEPRIRLVETAAAGVSAARNAGAATARGRYVAWLDSDNAWRPEFLGTMLGAMAEHHGLDAGYAISAVRDAGGALRYRRLDTGGSRERALELLAVSNFVDLNVLVVARELLRKAGGFDETLRRTVDYDLVWRLVEAGAVPRLVPFVGVDYDHDAEAADRITVREPAAWREVVKNRHLVDWASVGARPGRPGVSVLVAATDGAGAAWRSAAATAVADPAGDHEVVVVDDAQPRGASLVLGCLPLLDGRVRVRRMPRGAGRELATNLALADAGREVAVLLREGVELWPGWSEPLQDALRRDDAAAAQPVLAGPDGTIASAGRQGGVDLLAGLPLDDAVRAGVRPVGAAGEGALAARPADLAAVHGLDPLLAGSRTWGDLSLRLAGGWEPPRVALAAGAVAGGAAQPAVDEAPFTARWGEGPPGDDLLAAAGFDPGLRPLPRPAGPPSPEHPAGVPSLRWSIRISAPAGPVSRRWGDLHFARALGAALERLGQQVVIDHRPALHRDGPVPDDVVLTLRGLFPATPPPGAVSLLWVISHPDRVTAEEARGYDRVFAAGPAWAQRFTAETGVPVEPLLQATFPDLFHPDSAEADTGAPVLFVGNSRGVYRPIVRALVEAGVDVTLHGNDWERFVGPERVASRLVANTELPGYYRRAGIVLNDHWDDMRAGGFVSNRLFDAAACGARVVSDHLDGLDELFGGLVRTYRTPAELVDLVRAGASAFPDTATRAALAAQIAHAHSFDVRARTLLAAALPPRSR